MYEITNWNGILTDKLIKSYSDMQFAGVAAGNNFGRMWVDKLDNPSSAIVWCEGLDGFQFMGHADNQAFNNELRAFIDSTIISFLKEKKLDFFEYSADTEEWYPVIKNALSNREIKESWQYVYRSNPEMQIDGETILPIPYSRHSIDSNFISSIRSGNTVSNPEFLIDYIHQFWKSVENYRNLGCGYAAVYEDKIVSFAITSFLCRDIYSIGVETLEQHRRKGLAGTLAKSLADVLHEKGSNIWWDCMESNIASQKTAQHAGLIFDHKYKCCWFNF